MLKSAITTSRGKLCVHIFGDDHMQSLFQKEMSNWPTEILLTYEYVLHKIDYSSLPENLVYEWHDWYSHVVLSVCFYLEFC